MHDGKYMIVHLPWMQEIGKFDRLWEHIIIKIRKQLKCRSYFVVALMMASRLRIHSKVFHHTKSDSSATPILQNHIYYCHKNQYSLTSLFEGSLSILPTWYLQHSHSFDGVLLVSIFFLAGKGEYYRYRYPYNLNDDRVRKHFPRHDQKQWFFFK